MKHRGKKMIAALLAGVIACSNLTLAVSAKSDSWTHGWLNEGSEDEPLWHYYERGNKVPETPEEYEKLLRLNNFAFSGTSKEKVFTVYYLNEEGTLVENEGGSEITGPDGKEYMLTAGGAVKGGQLGSYKNGGEENLIWFTEPATGKMACDKWWRLDDEDGPHWFYFQQAKDYANGIGHAISDSVRTIKDKYDKDKMYYFNENGQMAESEFVTILSDDGVEYQAYAQLFGNFAEDKWLCIDDQWYYFKDLNILGSDDPNPQPVPVAVTGVVEIGGTSYEFDEEGCLISDNEPYLAIESLEISADKDSVYVGDKVTVNADIQVASASNAKVATMSNAQKKALADGDAYDAHIRFTAPGISNGSGDLKFNDNTKQLEWTFIPKVEGDVEIKLYVDGEFSNTINLSCLINEEKMGSPSYMKSVFENIMNSEHSGDEIVEQLTGKYQDLDRDEINKLRNDDGILEDLKKFEFAYLRGQGMNPYSKKLDGMKSFVDTDKISVVGAYLNADTESAEGVTFSMKKDTATNISEIEGSRKLPLDISLTGGNIDSSSLDLPVTITMPIPNNLSKEGLKLHHIHDGITEEIPLSQTQLEKGKARFTVSRMSTFVFAGEPTDNGSHGGSGGGSSSGGSGQTKTSEQSLTLPETPGKWVETPDGWQFLKDDGTLYSNSWIYVKGRWYWLESNGIMATGWNILSGKKYYLMPVTGEMRVGWIADGQNWYYTGADGVMRTGWVEVDGKWYYLEQDGHMLSSTTTPDNYYVNETGAWVEN